MIRFIALTFSLILSMEGLAQTKIFMADSEDIKTFEKMVKEHRSKKRAGNKKIPVDSKKSKIKESRKQQFESRKRKRDDSRPSRYGHPKSTKRSVVPKHMKKRIQGQRQQQKKFDSARRSREKEVLIRKKRKKRKLPRRKNN